MSFADPVDACRHAPCRNRYGAQKHTPSIPRAPPESEAVPRARAHTQVRGLERDLSSTLRGRKQRNAAADRLCGHRMRVWRPPRPAGSHTLSLSLQRKLALPAILTNGAIKPLKLCNPYSTRDIYYFSRLHSQMFLSRHPSLLRSSFSL